MVYNTAIRRCALLIFFTVAVSLFSFNVNAQCALSSFNEGGTANVPPCGTNAQTQQGSGTFSGYNIVNGATYVFETCGAPFDTQISGYNPGGVSVFTDDDGCGVFAGGSTFTYTSNFSGTLRVMVNRWNCQGWDGTGQSAILRYRQVDNLSVSSTPTFTCPSSPISLVGTPAGGTWSGTGVSGNTFNVATPGSYGVTYTLGQCSRSLTITVGSNSVAASSITVNPNPICQGGGTTLSVNGGTLGTNANWVWYAGSCGGSNVGTGSSILVSPSSTTTYFVRAEGGCATPTGCVSATVTVNTASTQPTTINSSAGTSVCPGSTTTLSLGNGTLGVGSTWQWYTGSCGGAPAGTGSSITPTITGPTTFFVRAVGPCETNTNCAQITINTLPASTDPTGITKSIDNFCPGANTTLTVSGGSLGPNADWVWYSGPSCCGTPIGTSSSIIVAPTSTTTYYVRAEGGCIGATATAQTTVTVKTESVAPTSINTSRTISCSDPLPTNVQLDVVGGSLGTGAVWQLYTGSCGGTLVTSNPSGSFLVAPATTTTYFIRASGDCNTTSCAQVTITVSSGITGVTVNGTQPSCNGGSNGTATATPTGGIAPYTYNWSNGQNTQTATGLTFGLFSVTVTDAGGCQRSGSVNISQPTLIVSTASSTNVTCNGGNNGTITFSASGGTGTLEYSVDGGVTYLPNPNFTGLAVGTYNLRVRDANGCVVNASPPSINLTSPPAITLTINSSTNASCAGVNDGSISSSAIGGTGGFQYSINGSPLQPGGNFNNLAAGNYTVLAQDNSGCTATQTVTINNNANFTVSVTGVQDVLCFGDNDGEFTAVANGGTAPFSYTINGFTFQNTGLFQNLDGGTYNVLVEDARGCQNTAVATIVEPSQIAITIDNVVNIGCNGGTSGAVNISVSGGTPSYTYTWNNGALTEDISGLAAGPYTVTVTDANSCTATRSLALTQAPPLFLNVANFTNVSCNGGNNGSVDVSIAGGTPPYSFNWSNGASTEDISSLIAGTYTVTVTDGNSCTISVTQNITQPSNALSLSGTVVNPDCLGSVDGSIDLTVNGGTSPYTYLWSNGQTSEDIATLSGGIYFVQVVDNNGCRASRTFTLVDPSAVSASAVVTDVSCFGDNDGEINLTTTGGLTPYTFTWSTGALTEDVSGLTAGNYSVTIEDNNGCSFVGNYTLTQPTEITLSASVIDANCTGSVTGSIDLSVVGGTGSYTYNWSTGAASQDISNLLAGTYFVTVTDANGCQKIGAYSVSQTNGLAVTGQATNVSCNGLTDASIVTAVTNAAFPITYEWSNGALTPNLFNIGPGTYSVSVTDNAGCIAVANFTITQPNAININLVALNDANCSLSQLGNIDVNVTGGTGTLTFAWSNGATTEDISNLTGGTYLLLVTDANGCNALASYNVLDPTAPLGTATATDVSCFGANDGSVTTLVSGGNPPYTYAWSNGPTTANISGVGAGLYSVTITDQSGCAYNLGVLIDEPAQLVLNFNTVDGTCQGGLGSSTAVVSGGTNPYTYLWSNTLTTATINSLTAGTYTVTVTDDNGCSLVGSTNVSQAGNLDITAVIVNAGCNGANTGSITTSIVSGVAPFTYAWSNGATSANLNLVAAGSYTVTLTDGNGCIRVRTFTVGSSSSTPLSVAVTGTTNADCANNILGSVNITVSGGTAPFTYLWTNAATTEDITASAGTYAVVVTDAGGCTATTSATINDPGALSATAIVSQITCNGLANGAIDVSVTGGSGTYSYTWSTGPVTQDLAGLTVGVYNVTVFDDVLPTCSFQLGAIITEPSSLVFSIAATDGNCSGGLGSIDLSVAGGTPLYTYSWNPGSQTIQDITNLTANTYSVTITDANGCSLTASTNISQAGSLDAIATIQDASCFGSSDGSVSVSVTGGVPSFTFAWSNGAATQNLSNVAAGTYTLTLTDANGCIRVRSFTVNSPTQITANAVSLVNADCANGILGSIDIALNGGAGAYVYAWTNGATTQDLTGLIAGTYVVVITDANSCSISASFTITDPSGLAVNGTANNVTCFGANNGSISVTATGGTGPYTYLWNGGSSSQTLNGLSPGSYAVTVTDNTGCRATNGFVITQPQDINLSTINTNVVCNGASTGTVDLVVSGGTSPYTFVWSNGTLTEDLINVSSGTYSVTVTDNNGCTDNFSVTLSQPNPINISASSVNAACNGGSNGSILLTVSGGFAPYTYSWNNGANTQNLTGLNAGTYTVTVTDANFCTASQSFTITAPASLVITTTGTDADCANGIFGSVDATVTGGTTPYVYLWNNFANTQDISGLNKGTYVLTVTDASGCTATGSFVVNDPSNNINVTAIVDDASCPNATDGAIDVSVTGGSGQFTYNWLPNGATTQDITGLAAGNYALTVTDVNGCGAFLGSTVGAPDTISVSAVVVDGTCGGGLGNIDLTVSGGVGGPYGFSWSNGPNTEDVTGLVAGTYTVTVTDAGGCTVSKSYNISQAGSLDVAAAINNVGCNGGTDGDIFLTVIGGNPPYTYAWNNGNITADILNVAPGTYTVSVTDINGCIKVQSFTVTQPASLQIASAFVTNVTCFGASTGAVDITVTGGTGAKTYLWSTFESTEDIAAKPAGSYTLVVTDANGCTTGGVYTITEPTEITITETITNVSCNGGTNGSISLAVAGGTAPYTFAWSNGALTSTTSGLTASIYTVTVTDANGCIKTANYTVTEPAALVLSATTVNVLCNGASTGLIDLTVSGGVSPYTYAWTGGATTQDVNLLVAGTYTVTVTDFNGCTSTATYTITQPSAISISSNITNVSCNGGSNGAIDINVTGGIPPYQYVWSNGLGLQDITGLTAGAYTVTVQDANNCTVISTFTVTQPTPVLVTGTVSNVTCNGGTNGSVTLNVSGGTPGYTYLWSNSATTSNLSGVVAGVYSVTVRDANQCIGTATFTITQPTPIVVLFSKTDVSCFGGNTGAIDITVSGGTPGYTYAWSHSPTTEDVTGLTAGPYTVIVTDANGCVSSQNITITQPTQLVATTNITNVTCSGAGDGSINLTVTGGTLPYTFNWSNGNSSEDLNFLDGGSYTVTVTDGNGCTLASTYSVTEPTPIVVLVSKTDVTCFGGNDGEIDITVGGGTSPYTFLWSNSATTEDVTGLVAGTYLVTVTDDNNCVAIQSVTINEPAQLLANNQVVTNVTCFGGNDGSIELDVIGGTPPYTFDWSNGATTEDIFNLAAGTYTLTVLDANFCGAQFTFVVTQPDEILANADVVNILCNSDSTGSVTLNVTGGTSPYTYNWSNGNTTAQVLGLEAGTYVVTVTDDALCTATFSFTITEPAALTSSLAAISPSCSGTFDGSIDLTVSGGVAPYSYFWSTFQFSQDIDSLNGGRYVVIITDANNCQKIDSIIVAVPDPLVVVGVPKGAGCGSDKNGEIGITVTGGSGNYIFIWSNGDTTEDLDSLAAGQYCVTVTDGNSCSTTACYVVSSLPVPIADFIINNACAGEQIQITNNTQLASGTLEYSWDFGPAGTSSAPNPAVTYTSDGTFNITLVAESDRGCFDTLTKQITIYALPVATITVAGANPGECVRDTAFLSVPADTNNLYLWSTGETTSAIFTTASDNYRVTVTTQNGCIAVDAADVFILNQENVSVSNDTTVSLGFPVFLNASGGNFFSWAPSDGLDNPNSANPVARPDSTTTYTVTVSDLNGCSLSLQVTITVVEDFNIGIPNLFTPNGDGRNDLWRIFNLDTYPQTTVEIFNRWGNKVWESDNYANDWNGTSQDGNELADGTYFYVIQVGGSDKVYKGDVNILR